MFLLFLLIFGFYSQFPLQKQFLLLLLDFLFQFAVSGVVATLHCVGKCFYAFDDIVFFIYCTRNFERIAENEEEQLKRVKNDGVD